MGPADLDDFYAITLPDDGTLNFTLTTNGGLQARTVGMNACVAKPFEVQDLMDAIRAHVG